MGRSWCYHIRVAGAKCLLQWFPSVLSLLKRNPMVCHTHGQQACLTCKRLHYNAEECCKLWVIMRLA